ncbi:APO protein 4, mitochondrial [Dorcoceras hygrometricum]|uniref:APO protein 4, mitochondrial n=1 Tax=Dorcoceras hygrometricum TaxID=472368 RepID=A0A2Z7BIN7_9LAMI|nr:APO protein 4, mitochondrial [Dorcoceras hygrometricum]
MVEGFRFYSTKSNSKLDFKKLRPMILNRIEERSKEYPITGMLRVAREVLGARSTVYDGVSTLIHHFPVWSCKHMLCNAWNPTECDLDTLEVYDKHLRYCPEVYIGEGGHLIQTCAGYRHHAKNKVHNWVQGGIDDVLLPVETYHLRKMFQKVIEHHERFDHDRIPAILELCLQAGVNVNDPTLSSSTSSPHNPINEDIMPKSLSDYDLRTLGVQTLKAWEVLRSGVQKLLLVYPARVCKHCSEVHVGPSGHKARMCGFFKGERWNGTHFWVKAKVDDLVPPNIVWFRRRQDPPVLVDKGRGFYGRAPAVVDLCSKAGAVVPSNYYCMMKMDGITGPV